MREEPGVWGERESGPLGRAMAGTAPRVGIG